MSLVVWVLWSEIKVDFNDLKHVFHLIIRFYELGNTIMTCFRDCHQFYIDLSKSYSGLGRRLVQIRIFELWPCTGVISDNMEFRDTPKVSIFRLGTMLQFVGRVKLIGVDFLLFNSNSLFN